MDIVINDVKIKCELLDTPELRKKGMSGRSHIDGGLLFKMDKGYHTFWMKECLFDLDIIFVFNNKITKVHKNCSYTDQEKRYMGYGNFVIEVPSDINYPFSVGDSISFLR